MRKRILYLLMMMSLVLTMVGCGAKTSLDGTESTENETTQNTEDVLMEIINVEEEATASESEDGTVTVTTDSGEEIVVDKNSKKTEKKENADGSTTYTTEDGTKITINNDGSAVVEKEEEVPASTETPSNTPTQPTHSHSYSSSVTKEATCTEKGVKTYTCSCGSSYTKDIDAKGHTSGDWVTTKEANCKAEGGKQKSCTTCGTVLETDTISKTSTHTPSDWVVTKEATCSTAGSKHKTCTVCGVETAVEAIAANGTHSYSWNTNGDTRTLTCSGCGATGITEYKYGDVWGYFDDAAAEELWGYINAQRNATQTGTTDIWGNPTGIVNVASLNKNDSLYSKAKSRAPEVALNFDHGEEEHECIAWGYGSAQEAYEAWCYSPGHHEAMVNPDYTIGGVAVFYFDSDNSGTNLTPIYVLELGY